METVLTEATDRLMKQCEDGAQLFANAETSDDERKQLRTLAVLLLVKVYFGYQERLEPKLATYCKTHPAAELRDILRETLRIDVEDQLKQGTSGEELRARWNQLVANALRNLREAVAEAAARQSTVAVVRPNLFRLFYRTF